MNKSVLLVLVIAALTGIGCGALIWTFLPKTQQDTAGVSEPALQSDDLLYTVTSPVVGTIEKRVPVTMHYDDKTMTASVANEAITDISRRPVMAIYRDNGLLYGNSPNITSRSSAANAPDTTLFYLSPVEEILEDKPEKAFLVLSKNPVAKRLPLSALMYDEQRDTHYVWIVNLDAENPDQGRAKRHDFSLHSQDDTYFDVGPTLRITALVVTNPDERLAEDQVVQVRFKKLNAPIRSEKNEAVYQELHDGKQCEMHDASCLPSAQPAAPANKQCSSCAAVRPKPLAQPEN